MTAWKVFATSYCPGLRKAELILPLRVACLNSVIPAAHQNTETMPTSERQNLIFGLNLLFLLSQNRMAEFHTELVCDLCSLAPSHLPRAPSLGSSSKQICV